MFAKKGFLIAGVVGIILSIIVWLIMQAVRASLIVQLGIIGANNVRLISVLAVLVVSLVLILIGLPNAIKYIKSNMSKKKLKDMGAEYRSKDSGPEEIREQLDLIMRQRTVLAGKIDRCIAQLDEIQQQLNRFDRLIKINEADALAEAREALEETQSTVCSNLKWVINSSVAATNHDPHANDRLGDIINDVIAVNKALLNKDEEFMLDLADHLSQVKDDGYTFQLDAWRETISSLNQKSIMG